MTYLEVLRVVEHAVFLSNLEMNHITCNFNKFPIFLVFFDQILKFIVLSQVLH